MNVLVLGGTAWLGSEIARQALDRGHAVTCLARGTKSTPPAGAEHVVADRDKDHAYAAVAGRRWEVVIDVTRHPDHARRAMAALASTTDVVVYVSSISVYADNSKPGADESAALLPALESDVMESAEVYGEAKVACEHAVLDAVGADRAVLVRAGLIGGPGDSGDRTGYWPGRFARPSTDDGTVLVPAGRGLRTQLIDVRDLATWILDVVPGDARGAFNVTGPSLSLPDVLATARDVAGHDGPVVTAEDQWLQEQGVQPWMGPKSLPLWVPMASHAGFSSYQIQAALDAGLNPRPIAETLAATLDWELARPADHELRAGLTNAEERDLLADWASLVRPSPDRR